MKRHRTVLCGGLLVLVGAFAFVALASGASTAAKPNVYWACIPKDGSIHMISAGGKCSTGQRLIKWNQAGLAGVPGAKGSNGAAGTAGAAGAPGPQGAQGRDPQARLVGPCRADRPGWPDRSGWCNRRGRCDRSGWCDGRRRRRRRRATEPMVPMVRPVRLGRRVPWYGRHERCRRRRGTDGATGPTGAAGADGTNGVDGLLSTVRPVRLAPPAPMAQTVLTASMGPMVSMARQVRRPERGRWCHGSRRSDWCDGSDRCYRCDGTGGTKPWSPRRLPERSRATRRMWPLIRLNRHVSGRKSEVHQWRCDDDAGRGREAAVSRPGAQRGVRRRAGRPWRCESRNTLPTGSGRPSSPMPSALRRQRRK